MIRIRKSVSLKSFTQPRNRKRNEGRKILAMKGGKGLVRMISTPYKLWFSDITTRNTIYQSSHELTFILFPYPAMKRKFSNFGQKLKLPLARFLIRELTADPDLAHIVAI